MVMTNQCDLPIPDIYVEELKRAHDREQLQQKTIATASTNNSSLIRPPPPVLSVTKRRGYSARYEIVNFKTMYEEIDKVDKLEIIA
uniref:Uncharacterized protein n=1 Tax=Angiostrongylus cantonensis TaxID=6313 RepID=A0A0K0DJZ0_ANGCA